MKLGRRGLIGSLIALFCASSARSMPLVQPLPLAQPLGLFGHRVGSFDALNEWLESIPHVMGSPTPVCKETGTPYVEVAYGGLARPGDEARIEGEVAAAMALAVDKMREQGGTIHWRIPLEWETRPYPQIIEFKDDGPDYDPITMQRCVMDRNWVRVAAYCRLTVSST